jgi:ABC-type multidrug transport system ATPase subunit
MGCCRGPPTVLGALLRKNAMLKRRAWCASCAELLIPLLFVALFGALKTMTFNVRVAKGWSVEGQNKCEFEVAPDGFNRTCSYPYTRFVEQVASFSTASLSFQGSWVGHEFARLCLATPDGAAREVAALDRFVRWVSQEGPADGPIRAFRNQTATVGRGTVAELEAYVRSDEYGLRGFSAALPECAAALVFDAVDFEAAQFAYTVRFNTTSQATRLQSPRTTTKSTNDVQRFISWSSRGGSRAYANQGFIAVMQLVDSFFIAQSGAAGEFTGGLSDLATTPLARDANASASDLGVFQPYGGRVVAFPVRDYQWDEFFFYVADLLPLVFVLCYLFPVAKIFEGLVQERETRTTEMLKMMGVSEAAIVASWYVTYAVIFGLLALFVTVLSRKLLPGTAAVSPGGLSPVVFLLFFLFGMGTMAFCFALSNAFWKARTASFVGVIVFWIFFFGYYSVNGAEVLVKPTFPLLFPQVAFSLTMQTIAIMEGSGVGAGAATLLVPFQGFSVAQGLSMLVFDFFLWTAAGFYLANVLPREFGQRLPFYYPLTPGYWRGVLRWLRPSSKRAGKEGGSGRVGGGAAEAQEEAGTLDAAVEPVEASLRQQRAQGRGIQVRGLRKEFDTPSGKKVALAGLDLDIYEGQILSLLGHNGAGKTTTLQILSGMLTASAGDATIMGISLREGIDEIRQSLGFCPQHDVLYARLSVREHLWFYGSLKGLWGKELEEQIVKSVADVGLTEKLLVSSGSLSGGQKRKLSVAIALIGGSKIVFVDEPTSGVDPFSRRSIWQVLQNNREGRTTILTTHFMDEADLLGDRIAIMAEGRLRCCGSSLFLKEKYGAGYLMTMSKAQGCVVEDVSFLVKRHVPRSRLVSNVGSEVSFQLPSSATGQFAKLFAELDSKLAQLGIVQYGISVTTLEEVFIKVARADDQREGVESGKFESRSLDKAIAAVDPDGSPTAAGESSPVRTALSLRRSRSGGRQEKSDAGELAVGVLPVGEVLQPIEPPARGSFFALHFGALFLKRVQYSRRDGRSFLCSVVMPLVLYVTGMLILKFIPVGQDDPAFALDGRELNPAFARNARLFMPLVELDADDKVVAPGSGLAARRELFGDVSVESALNASWTPPVGEISVFNHSYRNGRPTATECKLSGTCSPGALPPPLHGAVVLELAQQLIAPSAGVLAARNGASVYAATVLQPRKAEKPYSCLSTKFDVDVGTGTSTVMYEEQVCRAQGSPCFLLEGIFQGSKVCISVGCIDLVTPASIRALVRGFGDVGGQGLTDAQTAELVAGSRVMICQGRNCNTGPSNVFVENVCRGSPNRCVKAGLVSESINTTTYERFPTPNETYCSNETVPVAFTGGSTPPKDLGNSSADPRACEQTTLPQYVQQLAVEFVLNQTQAALNRSASFDAAADACSNRTAFPDCSFAVISGQAPQGGNVCVVDRCVVVDPTANVTVNRILPGYRAAQRAPCSQRAQLCEQVVDYGLLQNALSNSSSAGGAANGAGGAIDAAVGVLLPGVRVNQTALDALGLGAAVNRTALVEALLAQQANGTANATDVLARLVAAGAVNQTALTGALALLASGQLNVTDLLIVNGTQGLNVTKLIQDDPRFQQAAIAALARLNGVPNVHVTCRNKTDVCVMAQVTIQGQPFCLATGCASEFSPADYNYLGPLAGKPAEDVQGLPFFACNTNYCNYGCRGGGNCRDASLTPVLYKPVAASNGTNSSSSSSSSRFVAAAPGEVCPVIPLRYTYTAMVNTTDKHAFAEVANRIHNALLRKKLSQQFPALLERLEQGGKPLPGIAARTQGLPVTVGVKTIIAGILAFVAAIFALISFAFIPASAASYVVLEREVTANAKHQQLVSGVGIVAYWLSFFVFDVLLYLVPLAGVVGVIVGFNLQSYIENGALTATVLLFLGYGLAVIPFAYLTSNFFKTHTSALIGTLFINLITGLVLMIASYVMDNLDNVAVNEANEKAKPYYRIFPGFCLGDSLINLAILKILSGLFGPNANGPRPLDWDQTGQSIVMLYVMAAVFLLLVLLVEAVRSYPALLQKLRRDPVVREPLPEQDEDVAAEEARVRGGGADFDAVRVVGLRKVYGSAGRASKIAVRNVTLGIPRGETFGLLGINGAGKTTTLKMLTGDEFPSQGGAWLGGLNIMTQQRQVRRLIGYCPQFDALLPLLTVREHLELFGRIKGLRGAALQLAAKDLMLKLTLGAFEHKLAKSLSGGNKRKLSLAIAAIGAPDILIVDECTTGVDPVSKRFVWGVLNKMASGEFSGKKTTIIMTSHSMEEVEALCDRLCIMVGGRMRCLGSAQHLKHRFGTGLTLEVKLRLPAPEAVQEILLKLPGQPAQVPEAELPAIAKLLGSEQRMAKVTQRDDSAWAIVSHLQETGQVDLKTLLEWWITEERFEQLDRVLGKDLKGLKLLERHETLMTYCLDTVSFAKVFDLLEGNKAALGIANYAVSQSSLESVFNSFAKAGEEKGARGLAA